MAPRSTTSSNILFSHPFWIMSHGICRKNCSRNHPAYSAASCCRPGGWVASQVLESLMKGSSIFRSINAPESSIKKRCMGWPHGPHQSGVKSSSNIVAQSWHSITLFWKQVFPLLWKACSKNRWTNVWLCGPQLGSIEISAVLRVESVTGSFGQCRCRRGSKQLIALGRAMGDVQSP